MGIGTSPGGSGSGFTSKRRRDLVTNIALLGLLWLAYATVRGLTADDVFSARQNAAELMRLQATMGLPSEALLQSKVLHLPGLLRAANTHYVALHFPVTGIFLAWVWLRHRAAFSRVRNTLMAATSMGLLLHVAFPLAPPRMLEGFVDTGRWLGPDPYELSISATANQIAAMPSMHVGWALIVALGTIYVLESPYRWFSLLHPAVTSAVVVVTANHYWTDAIVAVFIVAAAWVFTIRIETGWSQVQRLAGVRSSEVIRPPVDARGDAARRPPNSGRGPAGPGSDLDRRQRVGSNGQERLALVPEPIGTRRTGP